MCGPVTLVGSLLSSSRSRWLLLIGLARLVDDTHHRLLQRLAFKIEAVLVPDEIRRADVKIVALHATLEERGDVAVIRVSGEGQPTAVVHELLKLGRLIEAELVNGDLLLLALDVIIFFVLRTAWQTLPRERATEEIE